MIVWWWCNGNAMVLGGIMVWRCNWQWCGGTVAVVM